MKIAFDIDGTLADCSHRRHFVETRPKDWDAFFAACTDDAPIPVAIEILQNLDRVDYHSIAFFTGRPERTRVVTVAWLLKHCGPSAAANVVYMRADGDRRDDSVVKAEYLDYFRPDLIFDDRTRVVEMWRSLGIPCFQVAAGNF